jgi:elongation factor Tu
VCTGVEMFRKLLDRVKLATTSAPCCAALPVKTSSAARCCASPVDQAAHRVQAEVYVLSKDEGGRHTPFFANYRPQFYFRTTDVTGEVILPEGTEMVMPGDNVSIGVKLIAPIAMDRRSALRDPRRRPYRGFGRGCQDHQVRFCSR